MSVPQPPRYFIVALTVSGFGTCCSDDDEDDDDDEEEDEEDEDDEWLAEADVAIGIDEDDEEAEAEDLMVQTAAVVREEFEDVRDFDVAGTLANVEPPPAEILPLAAQARTSPEAWSAFTRPLLALLRKR